MRQLESVDQLNHQLAALQGEELTLRLKLNRNLEQQRITREKLDSFS